MADNVPITAGSGTPIAADDISSVWYQRVKLTDGTADSTTAILGTSSGELMVANSGRTLRNWISVTSSGLTTSTTGYTAGDQMGAEMTFANAARYSGGTAIVEKLYLTNRSVQLGGVLAVVSGAASTPASDNAASAWSDANNELGVAVLPLTPMLTSANNQILSWSGYEPIKCSATSLFVNLVTLSTHTFFGAVGDMVLQMSVLRD